LAMLRRVSVVPHEAVNVGQSGEYVFVIDGAKKAAMRPVKVLYQDQTIAALGPGVEAGEIVVTDGQLRVTPGVTVSIVGSPNGRNPEAQAAEPIAATPQDSRSQTASQGAPG